MVRARDHSAPSRVRVMVRMRVRVRVRVASPLCVPVSPHISPHISPTSHREVGAVHGAAGARGRSHVGEARGAWRDMGEI